MKIWDTATFPDIVLVQAFRMKYETPYLEIIYVLPSTCRLESANKPFVGLFRNSVRKLLTKLFSQREFRDNQRNFALRRDELLHYYPYFLTDMNDICYRRSPCS